ncbi:hypothetical protein CH63R_01171 [Colletotrichum higginsianum IMI 349063]|uniref:Uncharacterized protein n=1 Tax=Colletotrichum higginsianum (strain IMI 349063) TaxID=759273 RepID=A0A1B7YVB3_COLHI|nr:hypothetical protein CH63R_01171 [Colletotrichum higginsianum IMI 349063]OBR15991.1 hypothetical protein CH63R_01171 [Colletotrichum higginsianum IMI 349063]
MQTSQMAKGGEQDEIQQSTTTIGKHFALNFDVPLDDTLNSSASNKLAASAGCYSISSSSAAAASTTNNNTTTTATGRIDYQYDDLLITSPSSPSTSSHSSLVNSTASAADTSAACSGGVKSPSPSSTSASTDVFYAANRTSQTDARTAPTPPVFLSNVGPSPSPTSNAGAGAGGGAGVGAIVPSPPLNPGTAAGEAGNDSPASNGTPSGNSRSGGVAKPVVIASSVVGAVAVLGLFGFLLWLWRKRLLKKRRSTLLTPLSTDPRFRHTENTPYVIDRGSLGPTPRSAKLKAALGYNFQRFRVQLGGLVSRNRDSSSARDRSQFMNVSQHSRNSSSWSNHTGPRDVVTTKDRIKDWWERLTADMKFNWRLRGDRIVEKDPFAPTRDMQDRNAAMGGQPDFLTLLGMDDTEVQREAQRRRLSRGQGSAGSADHFLGGLGLNFENAAANPFSDVNALPHDSAKPAPLAVANIGNDPFSDANAISAPAAAVKPPSTYVVDVRRSRGTSFGGGTTRPPSGSTYSPRLESMYRDSMQSVESFATRRNKFRSDPFDLERPELLGSRTTQASSNYNQGGGGGGGAPRVPGSAHTRADSFSSKYSSGVSMDGWSDPGPDVGPSSSGPSYRHEAESPVAGYRPGEQKAGWRPSGGSQNSVGKAL